MKRGKRKYLVYAIGSLGDTLVNIPALRAIKADLPNESELDMVYNKPAPGLVSPRDVLKDSGLIDSFLSYQSKSVASIFALWFSLIARRYEKVFYLAPSQREAASIKRDSIFFSLCGIKKKAGFFFIKLERSGGKETLEKNEYLYRLQRVEKSDAAIKSSAFDCPPLLTLAPEKIKRMQLCLEARRRFPSRALMAFCPGAKKQANQWEKPRFVALWKKLTELEAVEWVILGGKEDESFGLELAAMAMSGFSMAGKISVLDSAAVLKLCKLAITLDSGPCHLAAALDVPVVALYGRHNYKGLWDPIGKKHRILRKDVACAECGYDSCPEEDHPCMSLITVDEVFSAVRETITELGI